MEEKTSWLFCASFFIIRVLLSRTIRECNKTRCHNALSGIKHFLLFHRTSFIVIINTWKKQGYCLKILFTKESIFMEMLSLENRLSFTEIAHLNMRDFAYILSIVSVEYR